MKTNYLNSNRSKKAVLYRMVMDSHVCPYGIRSRDLLTRHGYAIEDKWLQTRAETDKFKADQGVKTTPQTYINSERIGGFRDLQEKFGEAADPDSIIQTYQPVIAIFGVALIAALVIVSQSAFMSLPALSGEWSDLIKSGLMWFMGLSITMLAVQKLRDIDSFINQFVTYDLVARRHVRYASWYPFLEAVAGLGVIGFAVNSQLPSAVAALIGFISLVVGSVGSASVVKAVYIDKRDLHCACVGGNSDLPLGAVSLTENAFMSAMGLYLLIWAFV